jgi:hypothetical protein
VGAGWPRDKTGKLANRKIGSIKPFSSSLPSRLIHYKPGAMPRARWKGFSLYCNTAADYFDSVTSPEPT